MAKNKVFIGSLCTIAAQVLFGFSFLFTKEGTALVSPWTLLSWRFFVAFLLFNICIFFGIMKVNFKGKSLLPLAQIALLQPIIYYIGETFGISLTTTSESGVILASIPIVTLLFSSMILKEFPTKLQVAGVSTTAIGIVIIVLVKGFEARFNIIGYTMLVVGVITYSLYSVFSQKAVEFSSVEKTYIMTLFGTIFFTAVAFIENATAGTLREFILLPLTHRNFLISVLYLAAGCSVAAFIFYNAAIAYIGSNRTVSYIGIGTIVNVSASIFILKEPFSVYQGIGTVLVLMGVYIANANPVSIKKMISKKRQPLQKNQFEHAE